jgi:glycosyltransferase involved in cell wall biosynthesis
MARRLRRSARHGGVVEAYSVVIPAHNAARFVTDAIASVRAQSVAAEQVIVVDDGSQDDTAARAGAAGAVVLRDSPARGPAWARNHGTRATRTPLVAYLDADDRWRSTHMATLLPLVAGRDDVVGFGSAETFGDRAGSVTRFLPASEGALDLGESLLTHSPVVQSGTVLPVALWERVGGYDESMQSAEDYDFWLRIALHGRFHYSGQATVERRVHDGQLSHRRVEMVRGGWHARRRYVTTRCATEPAFRTRALAALIAGGRDDLEWAAWLGDAEATRVITAEVTASDAACGFGGALITGVIGSTGDRLARTARTLVNRFRQRSAT